MRLLCDGVVLDLNEGTKISFTKDNALFAFDNLSTERTASFSLPSTPTNDRVFCLGRLAEYNGTKVRKKFNAELQCGVVVKVGYLYISKCTRSSYNAVFVTGQLFGLKVLKDAGNLADFYVPNDVVRLYNNAKNANDSSLNSLLWATCLYNTTMGTNCSPSIDFSLLVAALASQLGVSITLPQEVAGTRIVPASVVAPSADDAVFESTYNGGTPLNTLDTEKMLRNVIVVDNLKTKGIIEYHNGHGSTTSEVVKTEYFEKTVQHFKTLNDVKITFPDDLSQKYYLVQLSDATAGYYGTFYGDHSFVKSFYGSTITETTRTGEPLAGKTVDLPKNSRFVLVNEDDFTLSREDTYVEIDDEPIAVTKVTKGYTFVDGLDYSFPMSVASGEDLQSGDIVRLQDNLPGCTIVDLLKTASALSGKVLYYNEGSVTFDELDFSGWPVRDLSSNVVGFDELTRGFSSYVRKNIVRFDSNDDVPEIQRYSAAYYVDNDSLSDEKDLQVVPFSECGLSFSSGHSIAFINEENEHDTPSLIKTHNISTISYAERIPDLALNNGIEQLCDKSTKFIVNVKISLFEFEQIKEKVVVLINGVSYVWTSAQWSDGIAKYTLSKI